MHQPDMFQLLVVGVGGHALWLTQEARASQAPPAKQFGPTLLSRALSALGYSRCWRAASLASLRRRRVRLVDVHVRRGEVDVSAVARVHVLELADLVRAHRAVAEHRVVPATASGHIRAQEAVDGELREVLRPVARLQEREPDARLDPCEI